MPPSVRSGVPSILGVNRRQELPGNLPNTDFKDSRHVSSFHKPKDSIINQAARSGH